MTMPARIAKVNFLEVYLVFFHCQNIFIIFSDHADFFNLCPQRCNPKCQKPACHDILPQCQAFKSVCDSDEMIQWGCPVTCGKCQTEASPASKPECADLYQACSGWANNCEHKSIATACPATCKVI